MSDKKENDSITEENVSFSEHPSFTSNGSEGEEIEESEEEIKEGKIDFSEFKNQLNVHPRGDNGAYKTIQEAINAAGPKTKIVIHPAIYKEHLIISQKYDIELTSEDPSMPAIIIAANSPCIFISNMKKNCTVKLAYLRILHRGMRDDSNNLNNTTYDDVGDVTEQMEKSALSNSFSHLKGGKCIYNNVNQLDQFDINYHIDLSVIEGIMSDNRGLVSAITIFNSTVMIINTQITLGFLTTETTKIIPGIYSEKSVLFMESVMIKGNDEFLTCGVLTNDTSVKVSNSRLIKHKSGGILCLINTKNQIVITKTQFLENIGCGLLVVNKSRGKSYKALINLMAGKKDNETKNEIVKPSSISVMTSTVYLTGEKRKTSWLNIGEVSLESNLFDSNVGAGARVENCLNLAMVRNKFFENVFNGGEVIDCEGLILLNEFVKNGDNGLEVSTFAKKSEIKVSKNTFCENAHNGLQIKGKNNNCIVRKNDKITNNMKAGIAIMNYAFPVIKNNSISTNLHQGILVCDDSSADIEYNKIFGNLKANVALGGEGCEFSKILNNDLYRSRSEGIFIIKGNGGLIARNKVFENNDGICLFETKDIEISENDIYLNVRSGCLIASNSEPKMYQNQITENKFIGVMFRDGSKGDYKKNIIQKNPTQCYYTNSCKDLIDLQEKDNTILGRIDTETGCNIF